MKQRLQKLLFFNSFIIVQLCMLSGLVIKNDNKCQNNTTHLCNKQNNDLQSQSPFNEKKDSNTPIVLLFSLLNLVAYLSLQKNTDQYLKNSVFCDFKLIREYIKSCYVLILRKIIETNFYLHSYLNRIYCLYEQYYQSNSYRSYN